MITKDVTRLLADGTPRNVAQIAQELGISERQTWSSIGQLMRRGGRVISLPTLYTATERGKTAAANHPKTKEEISAARSVYDKERRRKIALAEKQIPRKSVVAVELDDDEPDDFPRPPVAQVVARAIASRPALQAVWGAM